MAEVMEGAMVVKRLLRTTMAMEETEVGLAVMAVGLAAMMEGLAEMVVTLEVVTEAVISKGSVCLTFLDDHPFMFDENR